MARRSRLYRGYRRRLQPISRNEAPLHFDGYNRLDLLPGKNPKSVRTDFVYFYDDGDLVGYRHESRKAVFGNRKSRAASPCLQIVQGRICTNQKIDGTISKLGVQIGETDLARSQS
jgi:hypothetical protein